MLLLCTPKAYVTMLTNLPFPEKTTIHLHSTKINKNPFVTRTFRPGLKECFCILYFWNTQQETGENKCKAVFYTYKQIGMPSLELFWPCSILAKNLGDVLARGLSYQGLRPLRPGLKVPSGLASKALRPCSVKGFVQKRRTVFICL